MNKKEVYQKKIEALLDEWKAEIDKMKAKADKVDADARLEYYNRIEELRAKHESAKVKLEEFKEAGEDAWEDLKTGVELAWESLGEAVRSARSKFK